jgi:hypothetical protein
LGRIQRKSTIKTPGKMLYKFRKEKIKRSFKDSGRDASTYLLPVTVIKEGKLAGSDHCCLSETENYCTHLTRQGKVDWNGRREDSWGISVSDETPQELATRRLG